MGRPSWDLRVERTRSPIFRRSTRPGWLHSLARTLHPEEAHWGMFDEHRQPAPVVARIPPLESVLPQGLSQRVRAN